VIGLFVCLRVLVMGMRIFVKSAAAVDCDVDGWWCGLLLWGRGRERGPWVVRYRCRRGPDRPAGRGGPGARGSDSVDM
jgi:hypothetical protein